MRIDNIDLYGDFKINGLTAAEGQFLGISGSSLLWLDAAQSTSGIGIYAENFVICQSVAGSPTASGLNLISAYSAASEFTNISATARGCVLIYPGVYDFGNQSLGLSLSYIDLVGVSSDANSVTLKSDASYTLEYYQGVDSGLYNVGLTGGSVLGVLGSASTYLRWGNVIVSGDCFSEQNENNYAFEELNGEFNDIIINDGAYFPIAKSKLEGIYKNITGNPYRSFAADDLISGTFSNINFGTVPSYIFYGSNPLITGNFENINIDSAFYSFNGGTISGIYNDITIGNITADLFTGANLSIDLDNVDVDTVGGIAFYSELVDSKINNLTIGTVSSHLFGIDGPINGTFSDISVGWCDYFFNATGNITGKFSNIVIGSCSNTFSSTLSISLEINNFKVDYPSGSIFLGMTTSVVADDILIGSSVASQTYFGTNAGKLTGTYRNIKIGDSYDINVFNSNQGIDGIFDSIEIVDCNAAFISGNDKDIVGTFSNFEFGDCSVFYSAGSISGNFTNIKLRDLSSGSSFKTISGTISGNFKNIEARDVTGDYFYTTGGDLTGTFRNIKLRNFFFGNLFVSNDKLNATFDNVEVTEYLSSCSMFKAQYECYIVANNIKVKVDTPGTIFQSSNSNLYGTVSNVDIEYGDIFLTTAGFIFGTYKNINLNLVGDFFQTDEFGTSPNILIENLNATGYISRFSGTMSNSFIDSRDYGINAPLHITTAVFAGNSSAATIEKCKFLSAGSYSISNYNAGFGTQSAKIYFVTGNASLDPTINNLVGTNFNVIDSNIL